MLNTLRKLFGTSGGVDGQQADPASKSADTEWKDPFSVLRAKWHEVPGADDRYSTRNLSAAADAELLRIWEDSRRTSAEGSGFSIRGWYHLVYRDQFRNKKVMDVGSGMGIDAVTFAAAGASVTCVDIVETNLDVVRRIAEIKGVADRMSFHHLSDISTLSSLPRDYDFIWAQGSMINAPFEVMRAECAALLEHLPPGGRWIELAYPKIRWEREGSLPFHKWGDRTDGGAPWVEWYDLDKLRRRLHPAEFELVFTLNYRDDSFNWFDMIRRA